MSHGILRFYDLAAQARIIANFGAAGQRHVRGQKEQEAPFGGQHVQTKH